MKKLTQKQIILNLLASQPNRKFKGYELVKVNTPWGWLGSEANRRARELAESDSVCHGIENKYAVYWHKNKSNYGQIFDSFFEEPLKKLEQLTLI